MHTNRTAIVTGASRGIGAAIARRFAADGIAVVVNYAASRTEAERVVKDIRDNGGQAVAAQADVCAPAAFDRLFDTAESTFGGVDILVNNAGVIQQGSVPIAETDDARFDRIIDVNVKGVFLGLRLAAARLRDGGRIVNLSTSLVGLIAPGTAVYAAAKSAVETMTKVFARELRGRDICVNAVAPGPTDTVLFHHGKTEDMVEQLRKAPPLERLGEPNDIAGVIAFLVGPDGGWVNGQVIRVNGGIV